MSQTQVEGLQALQLTMASAGRAIEQVDTSGGARLIQSRAQQRAPKRSGTLAGSIHVSNIGKGESAVSSELVYAPVIHYGWPARNIHAVPFLETAAADSTALVEADTLRQVNTILGRVRGA